MYIFITDLQESDRSVTSLERSRVSYQRDDDHFSLAPLEDVDSTEFDLRQEDVRK